MRKQLIMLAALVALPSAIYAGGYRVSLQGVRQAALGAQGAALTHDASVAFFNPAALAFVDSKFSIAVGGFGVNINSKFQDRYTGETAETNNPMGTPLYAAASYKPIDNLAIGLTFTTPFGTTIDWGNDWAGKYVIDRIQLKSYFFQPTVSYKFNDWFAVGASYVLAKGSVNIQKEVAAGGNDASLEINSDEGTGNGFSLGAFFKPTDKLNIGVSYRSRVQMEVENGDVKWENVPSLAGSLNPVFSANKFDAELPLPWESLFGISYQVTPKLALFGELGVVGWQEYSSLDIYLNNGKDTFANSSKKDFEQTFNYSLAAEYAATQNVDVRLGYKFDNNPSPGAYFNPETPTVDYHALTAGLGFNFGSFTLDAMGELLVGEERSFKNVETNLGGDIISNGFLFGLGLSYNVK